MNWNEELRKEFPGIVGKVYVNIAFNNPTPPVVTKAVAKFLNQLGEGNLDKQAWLACADMVRMQLADLINGKPKGISFTKNTVEGINIVAQGMQWKPGNNVIITDQDHLSNVMPWLNLRRYGVEPRVVKAHGYVVSPEDIFTAVDANTKAIAISSVQNSTGFHADMAAIGSRCQKENIKFLVDGIQTVGLMRMDVANWGIDAVACGGHKGLLGPHGIGFLYCSERLLEEMQPAYSGPSSVVHVSKEKEWKIVGDDLLDARRLEISNLNFPAIFGLHQGLQLIERVGVETIEKHILRLAALLHSGLNEQGYLVISPTGLGVRSGIVSLAICDTTAFLAYLKEAGIIASRMDAGYIRFSFGPFNNDEDVEKILAVTSSYNGSR